MERQWIDLQGLANLRDVGGIPTLDGGTIASGRLLRSDNLQSLTPEAIEELLRLGLTDVVDLRSDYEVGSTGPSPIAAVASVRLHHHSLFREGRPGIGADKPDVRPEAAPDEALPWVDLSPTVEVHNPVTSVYLSYLSDRGDSVVGALRDIARAEGATLVHCAAGKDRTGTIVALALLVAGADPEHVVADYAASSERMPAILDRLLATETYRDNLSGRPMSSHLSHPETMTAFLDHVTEQHGGVAELLADLGWTDDDNEQLRAKLRDL